MHAQNAIATRHALSSSQRRTPPAPDRRGDRRARPLPPRKPGRTHDPLRLCQMPMPQRPQPPARPLPVLDPQGRNQDLHPDAQPRTARAVPSPVRQHQAPPRADQRARDALSRSHRASRRMDKNLRGHLRRLQRLQRKHTPDNVSSPGPESRGPYSEDTQIRTPDNGGSARIIFVGVRHLASHHRSAVTPAGQALPCRYRIRNVPPCRAALPAEGHAGARNRHARIYAPAAHRTRRRITGHAYPGRVT